MKTGILSVFLLIFVLLTAVSCGKKEDAKQSGTETAVAEKIQELSWITNLEEGIAKAKAENKTVLVNFTGSDWCGWCIKLKGEVFSKKEFADYAGSSLVLVELDFPQRKAQSEEVKTYNRKVLEKYGVQGFPTIILINGDGKQLGKTGYQQGGPLAYIEHLKGFIK
jgi:protein disulfide-isomerase